jgi:catechol 2,3-dioxygenase-like lactoylglutathione lyase family enzyme
LISAIISARARARIDAAVRAMPEIIAHSGERRSGQHTADHAGLAQRWSKIVRSWTDRVLAHGGTAVTPPTDRDYGLRSVHYRDPDGNLVELQAY